MKNITWINTVRALCVIAVFFIHAQIANDCWWGSINNFILPFYVNCFFFVSGYLLFWKQLSLPQIGESRMMFVRSGGGKKMLLNILFRIIIPSIIFASIEFFPSVLIQGHDISLEYGLYKTFGGGTYWFTSALVVAELFLLLSFCARYSNIWFYIIPCFIMALIARYCYDVNIMNEFWAWNRGLMSLTFLALGGLYWSYEKRFDSLKRWYFVLPLLIIYAIVVMGLLGYNNPLISMRTIQPLGFISSSISCLLLVWLAKILPEVSFISFIGKNTLGFYFMSGALPIILSIAFRRFINSDVIWSVMIVSFMSIATACFVVFVINKYLPWLWDLRNIKIGNK